MNGSRLCVVQVGRIPEEEVKRKWLVERLWGASAVGLIGGCPKCCKSWLGLDLALSVATGTPCLDRFKVEDAGRALVYLAEDSTAMVKDRVRRLARWRGLDLESIDLHVIVARKLRLDNKSNREGLLATLQHWKPKLLVLDPLVRMHGIDENSATEVSKLLSYLRDLQRGLGVAIAIVHHSRKNGARGGAPGQALRGSGDLHAFGDSNLYLTRTKEALTLSMEHRSAPAPSPVKLRLVEDDEEEIHLAVEDGGEVGDDRGEDLLGDRVVALLREAGPLKRWELRERLAVKNSRLGEVVIELEERKRIARTKEGWIAVPADEVGDTVPDSPP